ncbi:hypothetical protein MXB_1503 [Myxobolus squamalis]|nr:hypothetical protein MXB_1503 [Myxobolus squamalis]
MNHKAPIINFYGMGICGEDLDFSPMNIVPEYIIPFNHYLLCCTEEQLKIINLNTFKTKTKIKLTATQGNRLKKAITFTTNIKSNGEYYRYLSGFSSSGKILLFSLLTLKCLSSYNFVPKEDIFGITTTSMTDGGIGIYQSSCSEITVFSTSSNGTVDQRSPEKLPQIPYQTKKNLKIQAI